MVGCFEDTGLRLVRGYLSILVHHIEREREREREKMRERLVASPLVCSLGSESKRAKFLQKNNIQMCIIYSLN